MAHYLYTLPFNSDNHQLSDNYFLIIKFDTFKIIYFHLSLQKSYFQKHMICLKTCKKMYTHMNKYIHINYIDKQKHKNPKE